MRDKYTLSGDLVSEILCIISRIPFEDQTIRETIDKLREEVQRQDKEAKDVDTS